MAENFRIRLVSFSDGSLGYRIAARRFKREASESNLFSSIEVYDRRKLIKCLGLEGTSTANFISKKTKGFGYWLWKPLLLEYELKTNLADAEILIYLDVGCTVNSNPASIGRLLDYCETARNQGVMTFHLPGFVEANWSKREAKDHFGLPSRDLLSEQRMAGVLLFSYTNEAANLVQDWSQAALWNHSSLLIDPLDWSREKGLRAHRHDQSLWSLVSKKHGVVSIPDETFFPSAWNSLGRDYPFWATRKLIRKLPTSTPSFAEKALTKILKSVP